MQGKRLHKFAAPLRSLGLIHQLDRLKFFIQKQKNKKRNNQFKAANPGIPVPPDYMLFESYQLNYEKYIHDGKSFASELIESVAPYIDLSNKRILDWGCGPSRISRHLPGLLPHATVYGTDYNHETIAWCKANIHNIYFDENRIDPPTGYPDGSFDFIFGISIFTHLSEMNHVAWFQELIRLLSPGGILYVTTHGKIFEAILTKKERTDFQKGYLVIRAKAKEGHRVFAAFHPPAYLRKLFSSAAIIEKHIPGEIKSWGLEQDVWILRKR